MSTFFEIQRCDYNLELVSGFKKIWSRITCKLGTNLYDDTSKGCVTAPDDGDPEGGAGTRYLDVGDLPLQDRQPGDS